LTRHWGQSTGQILHQELLLGGNCSSFQIPKIPVSTEKLYSTGELYQGLWVHCSLKLVFLLKSQTKVENFSTQNKPETLCVLGIPHLLVTKLDCHWRKLVLRQDGLLELLDEIPHQILMPNNEIATDELILLHRFRVLGPKYGTSVLS
jgi:hypothetical protein